MTTERRGRRQAVLTARELRRVPTAAESRLWAALRGHRLAGLAFRRQHAIGKFIADFYCPSARLVVEADGGVHCTPAQAAHDRDRDALFAGLGLCVLRVPNNAVLHDLPSVLKQY